MENKSFAKSRGKEHFLQYFLAVEIQKSIASFLEISVSIVVDQLKTVMEDVYT